MAWELVKADRRRSRSSAPSARVSRGSIHLNGAAVGLLGRSPVGSYAELMMDLDDGRVGIRFVPEQSDYAVAVRQSKSKGKVGPGAIITSRAHMRELFGEEGVSTKSTQYVVSLDPNECDVLVLTQ